MVVVVVVVSPMQVPVAHGDGREFKLYRLDGNKVTRRKAVYPPGDPRFCGPLMKFQNVQTLFPNPEADPEAAIQAERVVTNMYPQALTRRSGNVQAN
jgi:hypothetical protein